MELTKVSLTIQEWQVVLNVLGTAPFRDIADIITKLVTQVREAQAQPTEEK